MQGKCLSVFCQYIFSKKKTLSFVVLQKLLTPIIVKRRRNLQISESQVVALMRLNLVLSLKSTVIANLQG
jgi:hypothetical protein